jgi:hypothetical protein
MLKASDVLFTFFKGIEVIWLISGVKITLYFESF